MIRGLYTSGWSMMANSKKLDTISNNLANADTNAYKKDIVIYETFPQVLTKRINDTQSPGNPSGNIGNMQLGSDIGEIFTSFEQGKMIKTDKSLDMSIQNSNSAFFTVGVPDQDGNINEYYTRDGSFTINANGQLVTKEGYLVMGQNGAIDLGSEEFSVSEDGTIVMNGTVIDKLDIRDFTDTTTLRKTGENLIQKTDATEEQPFNGIVSQGYLEGSNVNIIREMVDMITVMRSYETNQKLIQAHDNTLDKAVNEVGSLR